MSDQTAITVLYADDDTTLHYVAGEMLQALGYRVLLAADGDEVLPLWQAAERVDLLLIDLRMRRMSGIEVIVQLRQHGCEAPAVLCTGALLSDKEVASHGAQAVLAKPYRLASMDAVLKRCLGDGQRANDRR